MACPSCVTENHKKHDFEDLRKVYNERLCKLEYLYDEMKADLQFVAGEENKTDHKREKRYILNDTIQHDITRQKEALIKTVESEAAKRLQTLNDANILHDNYVASAKEEYLRFKEDIKSKMAIVETVMNENDIDTIINAEKVLIPSFSDTKKPVLDDTDTSLKFCPGRIVQKNISQMFGALQQNKEGPEAKIDIVASYKTTCGLVTNLYSCKNGTTFVFDEQYAQCMITMQLKDGKIKTLKETKDLDVFDITEIEKNEFVVSFVKKTELKRIRPNGKLETFLDLSPLLPRALHLTKSGKLLVSVRDQGNAFPLKTTSERKLLVMTPDGKLIHEYYLDHQKKLLFSHVHRVTSAINNDIFVIDRASDKTDGSVVALGYPNKIIWRYKGDDSINTKFVFQPNGTVVTENCNIVVTDLETNIIHILSISGSLKYSINVGKIGIKYPLSLASDTSGILWVGCYLPDKNTAAAMLHTIKVSGI